MIKNKKGFTILEILVILVVLSILISLAIPRLKGMQDNATIIKIKGELDTLAQATESYYSFNNKRYPSASSGGSDPTNTWQNNMISSSPQIITTTLQDPFTANGSNSTYYVMNTDPNGKYYIISSFGPNGNSNAMVSPAFWNPGLNDGWCIFTTSPNSIFITNYPVWSVHNPCWSGIQSYTPSPNQYITR